AGQTQNALARATSLAAFSGVFSRSREVLEGHVWFTSRRAFRADGGADPAHYTGESPEIPCRALHAEQRDLRHRRRYQARGGRRQTREDFCLLEARRYAEDRDPQSS